MKDDAALEEHYRKILADNKPQIEAGGTGDEFLQHPERDTRRSVVLLFRIEPSVSECIQSCLAELKANLPELYYYPSADFHVTVLDVLRGRPNLALPEEAALREYIDCIGQAAADIGPLEVRFDGLTASDSAVLVKGYYQAGLEELRQRLRAGFRARGLPLEERYETFSCHITVARTVTGIARPEVILNLLRRNQERAFGGMTVRAVEFATHDWYGFNRHTFARIEL